MLGASGTARVRYSLRTTAVGAAALALVSVAGTAYAAPTAGFGSPTHGRSRGSFGAPSASAVYSGSQAVTQLTAIATATRAASTGGAVVTGTQFASNFTAGLTVTTDGSTATKVASTGPFAQVLYQSPNAEFILLDQTDPDVRAALQLMHLTAVHYGVIASTDPLMGPADILDQLSGSGAPGILSMKRTEHNGLVDYQITLNVPADERGELPDSAKVTTDRSGRLVAFSEATTNAVLGEQYTVRYGPQSVALPLSQDTVNANLLNRAITCLHLPQALASVAELGYVTGPSGSPETVTQYRTTVRTAATDPDNGMAGIAVTVADVPDGVTLTAHNPYTNANVTVRAALDGHGWVNVTDSAGRPVYPEGDAVGTVGAAALRSARALTLPAAWH